MNRGAVARSCSFASRWPTILAPGDVAHWARERSVRASCPVPTDDEGVGLAVDDAVEDGLKRGQRHVGAASNRWGAPKHARARSIPRPAYWNWQTWPCGQHWPD